MSNAVDTRVVEAKFDAEDFEKGVDKTLKKLDELKKSLNMKDSGKSVTEFSKITSEATEKANSSLEKLTNRLTTFTGMLKNQLISGLAGEVSGAFLRMEQSITGFFNTITSGAINNGMNRYTEILTSVRTMVAAGKDQAVAYEQIKLLGEYADQTSYSLSQMAGTMSKMVAAGAGVEEARKAVEGLANMAAAAGVNIYDANRAFLNFSQAYSSGNMRIQDWMSFESLNMSTEKTMKLFMEAGVMAGTLVKTVKKNAKGAEETVYKTVNKTNKKIQSGKQVAIKGFRDTLRYGWLDQSTMKNATALLAFYDEYGGDIEHLTEEQLEQAKAMYGAAREARSFADVMGTLKDVLATGWSTTFEHIFGQLEKATKFFTDLADSNILGILYELSDYRNSILETWNALTTGGKNGSDLFLQGLLNIDTAVGKISEKVKELFPDAEYMGRLLFQKTVEFEEATRNIIDWLSKASGNDEETRAEKIAKILGIVGTAFSVVSKIIGTAVRSIDIVIKAFSPIIDAVINTLSRFADSLATTNQETSVFDDMANAVQNIMIAAEPLLKILPPIIELLGTVASFFVDSAIATVTMNVQLFSDALGFVLELLGAKSAQELKDPNSSVLGQITKSVTDMKNAMSLALTVVKEFMGNLITDLKQLLGIGEIAEGEEGGFFVNVSNFFKTNTFVADAKAWIDQAIKDVGAFIKDIPNRLRQYAFNVWEFFHGLFYQKEDLSGMTGTGHGAVSMEITDAEVATPLKLWLDGVIEKVQNFVKTIPERIAAAAHTVGTVIGRTIESLIEFFLGDKVAQFELTKIDTNGDIKTQDAIVRDTLNSGFNTMLNTATNFVKDIPKNVRNAIKNIGTILENFWDGLFYEKRGKVVSIDKNGNKYWKDIKVKTPLKKFIDKAIKEASDFIKKIPEYVRNGLRSAGSVLGNLVAALFGKKDGEATSKDVEDAVMKPFANFSLSGLYAKIKEIATNVGNWVMSIFTGSDDLETNQTIFAEKVAAGITWIKEHAEQALTKISTWFTELPHKIAAFFSGERIADETNKEAKDMGPVEKAVRGFAESIGHFIESLPDTLLTFFDNAIFEIGKLWDRLYNALSGESENKGETKQADLPHNYKNLYEQFDDMAPDAEKTDTSKWKTFVEHLGTTISDLFAKIPTFISQGIDLAIKGIDWAISGITEWFAKENVEATISNESKKAGEIIVNEVGKNTEEGAEDGSSLLKALGNIGQSISNLITKTIPGFLKTGWDFVKNNAGGWWESFKSIFDGLNIEDLHTKITDIGQKIEGFIKEIPGYIHKGVDWIKAQLSKKPETEDFSSALTWDRKSVESVMHMKLVDLSNGAKKEIESAPLWDFTTGTWSKKLNETAGNIKEETDDGGIWGIVKSIGESIRYAFSQLGPYIMDGINSAIGWINKGIEWMTNFLVNRDKNKPLMESLTEAVAGEDGVNKEFAESAEKLGENISSTLTNTIPKFIGEAAKEVAAQAPNILDILMGGLISSASAEDVAAEMNTTVYDKSSKAVLQIYKDGTEKLIEAQDELYKQRARLMSGEGMKPKASTENDYWKDGFGKLDDSIPNKEDTDKATEKAKGAKSALDRISDLIGTMGKILNTNGEAALLLIAAAIFMSQIKDILSFADEVEAFGETAKWQSLKIAVAGIVGLVAYVAAITQTQTESQLQKTWNGFDKIVSFVERIAKALTLLKGLSIGANLAEALGSFFDSKTAKWNAKAGGAYGGNWFSSFSSSIMGTLAGYVGIMVGGQVFTNSLETWGTGISDTLYSLANGVTSFIEMLMPGFNAIIEADTKIGQATEFVGKLKDFVEKLVKGTDFSDIGTLKEGTEKHEFSTGDEILKKRLETIYSIGQMLTSLTSSVNAMPDLETAKAKFAEVTDLMDTQEFKNLLNKASDIVYNIRGITDFEDVGIGMQMLGNTLGIFTGALSDISPENVSIFEKVLGSFDRIVAAYTNSDWSRYGIENLWKGDKSISNFGLQIQQFGGYISRFFESVKKINVSGDAQVKLLQDKIDMVVTITKGFAEAAKDINGTDNGAGLSDMASRMTGIGSQIASFINALHQGLNNGITLDDLSVAKAAAEIFRDLAGTIHDLYVVGAAIPEATLTIGEMIKGIVGDPADPGIDNLVSQINSLVLDDLNLTPTITPVIDMSNVDEAFNSRFGPDWKFNFDPGTVQAQLANPANANGANVINTQVDLSGINSKLDSVNIYLSSILAKNPAYSVYMDTGALVGSMGPQMYNYISAENMRRGRT